MEYGIEGHHLLKKKRFVHKRNPGHFKIKSGKTGLSNIFENVGKCEEWHENDF